MELLLNTNIGQELESVSAERSTLILKTNGEIQTNTKDKRRNSELKKERGQGGIESMCELTYVLIKLRYE